MKTLNLRWKRQKYWWNSLDVLGLLTCLMWLLLKYNYWWITSAIVCISASQPSTGNSSSPKNSKASNWASCDRSGGTSKRSSGWYPTASNSGGTRKNTNSRDTSAPRRGPECSARPKITKSCKKCWRRNSTKRSSFKPGRSSVRSNSSGSRRGNDVN